MRQATSGRIRTFSAGFDDPRFDERPHAARVAKHLETEHHELLIRPDAAGILAALAWHYDSPLADSSAIPTMAISAEARRHVTVVLSGDGGDETLLGYERYAALRWLDAADRFPRRIREAVAALAARCPAGPPRSFTYRARRVLSSAGDSPLVRYASFMALFDDETRRALWADPGRRDQAGRRSIDEVLGRVVGGCDAPTFLEAVAWSDLMTYLPGALMTKVDLGSMAHSLEVRSPLLDHELIEFTARIPLGLRFPRLTPKALLKDAVRPWLPSGVLDRPKAGFNVPLHRWLGGSLGDVARDILLSSRAIGRGLFEPAVVARILEEQQRGTRNWHSQIWGLLVLEWWHRTWIDEPPSTAPPRGPSVDLLEVAG
jgi:asparagine synthase (glutamine-hydrolysing)